MESFNLVNLSVDTDKEDWCVLLMFRLSNISNKKHREPILIIESADICQNTQVKGVF